VSNLSQTTAIILAGGLGMRLRAAVADRPKVLAAVAGRPFLAYLLEQIEAAGILRAILCTGYRGEQVRAAFGPRFGRISLEYSQEAEPRGTGGALALAAGLCQSDQVLAMNGDSYCRADLAVFASTHGRQKAKASLLLTQVEEGSRFGRVCLGAEGAILNFEEKGGAGGPACINAGIYLIQRPLLDSIPTGRAISLEREVFPQWMGRGLFGQIVPGPFLDIGTPESYARAERFLAGEKAA
jgi:NDP-sugar pyrophosphorylase family protein